MSTFKNAKGNPVLMKMVKAIHENKDYLGEVDSHTSLPSLITMPCAL